MSMNDRADIAACLIKLAVDTRFVGRLQASVFLRSMPVQISADNVPWRGEKKPSLFFAAAANQHALAVAAARAHMTGGFFEQSELGENLAGQCDLSG
jgi:hypothetical protein